MPKDIVDFLKKVPCTETYPYPLVTYADALEFLQEEHGIYIELDPVFTFATADHVAYYVKAFMLDEDSTKLRIVFKDEEYMYSFANAIETVLRAVFYEK